MSIEDFCFDSDASETESESESEFDQSILRDEEVFIGPVSKLELLVNKKVGGRRTTVIDNSPFPTPNSNKKSRERIQDDEESLYQTHLVEKTIVLQSFFRCHLAKKTLSLLRQDRNLLFKKQKVENNVKDILLNSLETIIEDAYL